MKKRETGMSDIMRPVFRSAALARLLAAVVLLALPGLTGCDQQKAPPAPPPPPRVAVAKPQARPVTDYLEFTGNTRSAETVELRARVEGYLRGVNFKDGAMVKKGDTLFEIEPQTYEANLRQAQAEQNSAEARLAQAEAELTRAKTLLTAKAGPATDVTKWTQERDSARADMETAKAKIEVAKLNLSYVKVLAPFDGRIGRRMVDPGNLVGAGERTVLATLIRQDPIHVYFTLNERDFLRLKEGKSLQGDKGVVLEMGLSNQSDYPFKGRLDFQDLGVDPQTGTILLRGVFPNPKGEIVPGLFVRIRAPLETKESMVVPETAVSVGPQGRYVLVVNDKNVVEPRPVQTGVSVNGQRVVSGGLTPEDRVVVSGLMMARPGTTVAPMEAGAAPAGQPGQGQPAQAPRDGQPAANGPAGQPAAGAQPGQAGQAAPTGQAGQPAPAGQPAK